MARSVFAAIAFAALLSSCSLAGGTLGGREKCWPAEPSRAAAVLRGVLTMDENGFRLITSEGETIWLISGAVTFNWTSGTTGQLVDGSGQVLATAGQDMDLFGGAGADGGLVVCAVEEVHQ